VAGITNIDHLIEFIRIIAADCAPAIAIQIYISSSRDRSRLRDGPRNQSIDPPGRSRDERPTDQPAPARPEERHDRIRREAIDCRVRNISATSAALHVESQIGIAPQLKPVIPAEHFNEFCRVLSRKANASACVPAGRLG
jgi:hypothetical protein